LWQMVEDGEEGYGPGDRAGAVEDEVRRRRVMADGSVAGHSVPRYGDVSSGGPRALGISECSERKVLATILRQTANIKIC
jgi:hypothetical protein